MLTYGSDFDIISSSFRLRQEMNNYIFYEGFYIFFIYYQKDKLIKLFLKM